MRPLFHKFEIIINLILSVIYILQIDKKVNLL